VTSSHQLSAEYAALQRRYYDDRIHSLTDAQNLVGCYQEGRSVMPSILQFVIDEYRQRRFQRPLQQTRMLDFGCGVGRIMEAARELGIGEVDGVDISESMLNYARHNPALAGARTFLGGGADCGDAPRNYYHLITSFFCLQHVCHHGNRMGVLRAMNECLADDGMVALELQYFPTISANEVPGNHAPWGEDRVASVTNSEADVWITPDRLGAMLADMSSCFRDVSLQFVDLFEPEQYDRTTSAATENYQHPFTHIYVFGTKRRTFASTIYRPLQSPDTAAH
jgi:SAM-dependent methyltransferase